ncbi:MAG: hypothetical protein IPP72_12930 [Chitinophagaceae bacterium]|nr:hypothetical protein [Chitinophagaceae bacterium]
MHCFPAYNCVRFTFQDFNVPKDYTPKVAADYIKYEKDMIAAATWLKATALNEQEEKHKEVAAFVMSWIGGSPTVKVEINETIMDFEKRTPVCWYCTWPPVQSMCWKIITPKT